MFRGRSSSGRAPPCQGGGSEFEPRRPLQKRGHNVCCDLFFGFRQEIKMLGRSEFALRQGFAAQNACTAQKRRFFGSSGQRGEQGASEARKRPSGAFVARSKKEVTTYVVTSFLDSGRKLKCLGEVNSPSAKVLLRKTLVRRKSADFLDSGRKLKCSGEVNSPSVRALLRKKRRASFALFLQNDLKAMENIAIIQLKNKNAAAYGCANTHMPAQVSLPPTQ